MSKKRYRGRYRHTHIRGKRGKYNRHNVDAKTVAGIVIIAATVIALFIVIVIGSQWFGLPLVKWFNYWGLGVDPTGIKISPDIIIAG